MKKVNFYLSLGLALGVFCCSLEAVVTTSATTTPSTVKTNAPESKTDHTTTQEKFDIMHRDEIDDTDVLAIPFDDSEIEDEEEINELEGKEEFPLPHSPGKGR